MCTVVTPKLTTEDTTRRIHAMFSSNIVVVWYWDKEICTMIQPQVGADTPRVAVNMRDTGESIAYLQTSQCTFYIPYMLASRCLGGGIAIHCNAPSEHRWSDLATEVRCMINCIDIEVLSATASDGKCFACRYILDLLKQRCEYNSSTATERSHHRVVKTKYKIRLGDDFITPT